MFVNGNRVKAHGHFTTCTVPCIVDSGNPNNLAEYTQLEDIEIGMLYMDKDSGDLYKCTAEDDGVYIWEKVGGGGVLTGSGAPTWDTKGEVGQLYMDTDSGELYKLAGVYGTYHNWTAVVGQLSPATLDFSGSGYPVIMPGQDDITLVGAEDPAYADMLNQINRSPIGDGLKVAFRGGNKIIVNLERIFWNDKNCYVGVAMVSTYEMKYLLVILTVDNGIKCRTVELSTSGGDLDTTLSVEGKAADAKAVGDALGDISVALDHIIELQEGLIGL